MIHCINRNIVECKDRINVATGAGRRCINRNIVECKVLRKGGRRLIAVVLIETLWNVKFAVLPDSLQTVNQVLIETLWNVK